MHTAHPFHYITSVGKLCKLNYICNTLKPCCDKNKLLKSLSSLTKFKPIESNQAVKVVSLSLIRLKTQILSHNRKNILQIYTWNLYNT